MNTITQEAPLRVTPPTNLEATEVVLPGIVEPSGLQIRRRVLRGPAAGQALVRVEASGVSFAEKGMRRGRYPGQPKFPFVPGYDLVGTVVAVGGGVSPSLVGKRVAALTKTGAWASLVLLQAEDLMPVPEGVDPAEAEPLIVSGITAWQMLHHTARIRRGQTILVHGANGSVGTTLVQLAKHVGVRVIGTASPRHHDALREMGVEPLDYNDADLAKSLRRLAPQGADAVFDHVGGESAVASFKMLAPGGTLVCYGTASKLDDAAPLIGVFLALIARLAWWSLLPNGHKAVFYNVWAGHTVGRGAFRARLRRDFGQLIALLSQGVLTPQIAARFPLEQASAALELAESRTAYGKVVLMPRASG